MFRKFGSKVSARGRGGAALLVGLSLMIAGGLAVSLAAAQGDAEQDPSGSGGSRSADAQEGAPHEPSAEDQMATEEFRACMSDEGFEPPEPGERPERTEDGPPEGLSDALEQCRDLLPEGGPPGFGPGPGHGGPGCHGLPPGEEKDAGAARGDGE